MSRGIDEDDGRASQDRFGIDTKKLIGEAAYGTAEFLAWMVNKQGIEPHVLALGL